MLVYGCVELAIRVGNEVAGRGGPLFIATYTDAMADAAGAGVGADESPVVSGVVVVKDDEVVHDDLHVGEGGHEVLGSVSDSCAADRGEAVNGEGAVGREMGGYGGGILAAPGRGVVSGEGLEIGGGSCRAIITPS